MGVVISIACVLFLLYGFGLLVSDTGKAAAETGRNIKKKLRKK